MDDSQPRLRASDDDRNRVNEALGRAFSEGRIDFEEFDERTRAVLSARFRDELSAPLADLLPDPTAVFDGPLPSVIRDHSPAARSSSAPARRQVTGEPGGSSFSLAIMGGTDKKGDWLIAPSHVSVALMGGTVIDLTEARLSAQETVIYAVGLMGGVEILVPEDFRVISEGVGVMGGFEVSTDDEVKTRIQDLPADAPVVRVRGIGLMGGVEVKRVPRRPRE